MNKFVKAVSLSVCCLVTSATVLAQQPPVELPASFFGATEPSSQQLDFSALDAILSASVLDGGGASRESAKVRSQKAGWNGDSHGKRISPLGDSLTRLDASRFYYEAYAKNPQLRDELSRVRRELSALPTHTPLDSLSKNEQLAYWLNLYTVTVLDEVVKVYPRKDLASWLLGSDGLLMQPILEVAGVRLSLNDIQFNILAQQFPGQPEILYGLYQGYIGSPSLSATAFTGANVHSLLAAKAHEFINSNRGTQPNSALGFRVSGFYQRSASFFPDFQPDLTQHLARYLQADQQAELYSGARLMANIDNFNVTDLYGTVGYVAARPGSRIELSLRKARDSVSTLDLEPAQLQMLYSLLKRHQQSAPPALPAAEQQKPAAAI